MNFIQLRTLTKNGAKLKIFPLTEELTFEEYFPSKKEMSGGVEYSRYANSLVKKNGEILDKCFETVGAIAEALDKVKEEAVIIPSLVGDGYTKWNNIRTAKTVNG